MVLFVVGMSGERIILDMDRTVVEYGLSQEMVEKVDWIIDD